MNALVFDRNLRLAGDWPEPVVRPGWATIAVRLAGICRTDLEIARGYMGYRGVLGHEFVGTVAACDDATWVGARVVGEINAACGACDWCARGLDRHCPNRTVLGILGLDGCLAERCALPIANLHRVPEGLSDAEATFVEPVSAAFEMLEQLAVAPQDRCVVLGDGKLGILCAWALATVARNVTLAGHHPDHLARAQWGGVHTTQDARGLDGADVVVEATGSPSGFEDAMRIVRPRGTIVLKSTLAAGAALNLAMIVVNEVTVVGSRCGPFERGLGEMERHRMPVARLIDATYPLEHADEAFEHAARSGTLKVLVRIAAE